MADAVPIISVVRRRAADTGPGGGGVGGGVEGGGDADDDADHDEPLVDLTKALALHSKRTERQRKKLAKRADTIAARHWSGLLDMPYEILTAILSILCPRDVFVLLRVSKPLRNFILSDEDTLAASIISLRYASLERCFLRPVLMQDVDSALRAAVQNPDRQEMTVHKRPFQHIQPPDMSLTCTCLTCMLRWNCLCLVVDFAHWQGNLEKGKPILPVPRGRQPEWNQTLVASNAAVVVKSLRSRLWHARILEAHLDSTTRSIRRHGLNKGNRRRRFRMTDDDVRAGTDAFLERSGPPTLDFPFNRDQYYMLEAFLPNRSWISEEQKWVYMLAKQHDTDLEILMRWDAQRRPRKPRENSRVNSTTPNMEDLHDHFGRRSLWPEWDVFQSPVIDVTEIWGHDESSATAVETRAISSADLDTWLDASRRTTIKGENHTRLLRIVWVGQNPQTSRHSPSTKALERLLGVWDLKGGFDYARSCFAGVAALPRHDADKPPVFSVAYHPKLALAWSRTGRDGSDPEGIALPHTQAVVFAEGDERTELLRILQSQWSARVARHVMFPALLAGLVLGHELDSTLDEIKLAVRQVEERTGHHRFTSRRQTQPAAGELGSLSAQMSGCAAKLANGTRKLKVVDALNEFMLHDAALAGDNGTTTTSAADDAAVARNMQLLQHRASMQAVDTAYVQQRIQIQIAALFHLIAQQDNAIAFDTASATRSIAASSLQDSSSMKMLALVAMFFLPGSFVAALFSTPLFVWDDGAAQQAAAAAHTGPLAVATRPQFALFWAISVPMTVAIFVLYAVWMVRQKKKDKRRRRKGVEMHVV
ncbi:hypothetical protein B0T26DRAFT_655937 [Lasiosphaeria miniovina]|uniref:F-box domain-containing protein n=1 Tax=Lasiosphaeria miniovina TaxID=1954250 RepID=A0AA40DK80_9PEZI|nr:uncharacterized protein B0T26DRAFT_655937 [Lasiosphaeria miniovina]KAK0706220.1 hypothetical protein B0T26DRAFT_655937 [Lasiosphaeria miniovina]